MVRKIILFGVCVSWLFLLSVSISNVVAFFLVGSIFYGLDVIILFRLCFWIAVVSSFPVLLEIPWKYKIGLAVLLMVLLFFLTIIPVLFGVYC